MCHERGRTNIPRCQSDTVPVPETEHARDGLAHTYYEPTGRVVRTYRSVIGARATEIDNVTTEGARQFDSHGYMIDRGYLDLQLSVIDIVTTCD